ncbi:MAG: TIGR03986 family CRISPR-associated RAMP protein [bacterium]|nr:TIGR03986 family CRISPR-associated RAMP protein [bacterium]
MGGKKKHKKKEPQAAGFFADKYDRKPKQQRNETPLRGGGHESPSRGEGHDNRDRPKSPSRGGGFESRDRQHNRYGDSRSGDEYASAPYSFIPLNETVVPSDTINLDGPEPVNGIMANGKTDFSRYFTDETQGKKYTGCIELDITTKTPLYIRDSRDDAEDRQEENKIMAKAEREKLSKARYINADFFSPAGRIRIPGSTLRGMLRSMVEIVSFSKMTFFEAQRKYHFRAFADKSLDLRKEYREKLAGDDAKGNVIKELRAGYLVRVGIDYKIIPAKKVGGLQWFRVDEDLAIRQRILKEPMSRKFGDKFNDNRKYDMGFVPLKFEVTKDGEHDLEKVYPLNARCENAHVGSLVFSGWMRGPRKFPRGKHKHWVVGPPSDETMELADGVLEDYKRDVNRTEKADLLRHFKKNRNARIPCFYVEREVDEKCKGSDTRKVKKVISFGHTGLFRLAYEQSLEDLLPQKMRQFQGVDIAGAIFGNESAFAGRVFCRDAFVTGKDENILMEENMVKILSSPKPTTFQHYLKQNTKKIKPERNNLWGINNYNTRGARLAGTKMYWHKSDNNWLWKENLVSFHNRDFETVTKGEHRDEYRQALLDDGNRNKKTIKMDKLSNGARKKILDAVGIYETQHTKIKAVKTGVTFGGKICFENLSPVELGALLFALQLPEGLCHKLGMGKALGLGSVSIRPSLHLSDREARYRSLFAEWKHGLTEHTGTMENFKDDFASYVLSQQGRDDKRSADELWQVDRMKELSRMLDYENKPKDDTTQYLELREFRNRNTLRKPSETT